MPLLESESLTVLLLKRKGSCTDRISARYVLTFMVFCGLFVLYCLRVSLSVSIIAMVNNTAVGGSHNAGEVCEDPESQGNGTEVYNFQKDGEFQWDAFQQGIVLGVFYYGYAATQLLGGWLAERFGGKWPFGIGVLSSSIFTLLTARAARSGLGVFVLDRVLKGLGEGVTYPAMYVMLSRWAPLDQRSLLIALASIGANLGTIVGIPAAAMLCEYGFDEDFSGENGWPSVFYIFGGLGCVWFVFWWFLAYSSPSRHPRISHKELIYLKQTREPPKERPTPWRKILTSGPVWAATITRFLSFMGYFTLLAELPTFLENVLRFNINQCAGISALVYTAQSAGMILGGYISDHLRRKFSINVIRKGFEAVASVGSALLLVAVPSARCDRTLVPALLIIGQGLYGFNSGGSLPAIVDIAPELSGTVSGIVYSIGCCSGIIGPLITGALMKHGQGLTQWGYVFYIIAGMYFLGAVTFVVFGSAEVQPWAHVDGLHDRERMVSVISRSSLERTNSTSSDFQSSRKVSRSERLTSSLTKNYS